MIVKTKRCLLESNLLPPAYVVRGKVLFSQVSVCSHLGGGGTYLPGRWGGVPTLRSGWGGVPTQLWTGGGTYLGQGGYLLSSGRGGVPTLARVGGVPTQLWTGGVPTLAGVGEEGYLPWLGWEGEGVPT